MPVQNKSYRINRGDELDWDDIPNIQRKYITQEEINPRSSFDLLENPFGYDISSIPKAQTIPRNSANTLALNKNWIPATLNPTAVAGTLTVEGKIYTDEIDPVGAGTAINFSGNITLDSDKTVDGIDVSAIPTTYVPNTLFDANTVIKADTDNTPIALPVAVQTLVGRITGGVITALTVAQCRTLLGFITANDFNLIKGGSFKIDTGNSPPYWSLVNEHIVTEFSTGERSNYGTQAIKVTNNN